MAIDPRSTFGRTLDTTSAQSAGAGKTFSLVGSGSNPTKIDCSGNLVMLANVYCSEEWYATYAESQSDANTKIASDDTRWRFPAGNKQFDVGGETGNSLYVRAASASPTGYCTYDLVGEA